MTELPKSWPDKRNLAVSVSVMLEAWTDDSAPGIGPMGNPLKAGVLDLQGRSWAEYGPKVGAWRILDILADAKVSAVFYVSGILAERYPELLKAIVAAGHEVAAHGWGQNIIPATQAADDEASDLGRCVEVLQRALAGADYILNLGRFSRAQHISCLGLRSVRLRAVDVDVGLAQHSGSRKQGHRVLA